MSADRWVLVPGWAVESGTGGFSEKGDRWVCVRHLESQCGQDFYEDRDPLIFGFLSALAAAPAAPAAEPFVVKHYSGDERPCIKGNGFDGLQVGEDRDEAEAFVRWLNVRIGAAPGAAPAHSREPLPEADAAAIRIIKPE